MAEPTLQTRPAWPSARVRAVVKLIIKKGGSNKTKAPGKIGVPAPFIDKISIVITPDHAEHAADIHSNIWDQFKDKSVFQAAGQNALKGGWNRAHLIALKGTEARPLLQYRYSEKQAKKLRLEFNPRKVEPEGMHALKDIMGWILLRDWDHVAQHSRISRIDIAVDLPKSPDGQLSRHAASRIHRDAVARRRASPNHCARTRRGEADPRL